MDDLAALPQVQLAWNRRQAPETRPFFGTRFCLPDSHTFWRNSGSPCESAQNALKIGRRIRTILGFDPTGANGTDSSAKTDWINSPAGLALDHQEDRRISPEAKSQAVAVRRVAARRKFKVAVYCFWSRSR
jgi:hypothetical protein